MSKITSTQKLIVESVPEQREWIAPVFALINKFMSDVISSVNGGIEFSENIQGKEFEYDFVYISATASFPQTFQWSMTNAPRALTVIYSSVSRTPSAANYIPLHIGVVWDYSPEGFVRITDAFIISSAGGVEPLTPNYRYKIKVRVTP